MSNKILLLLCSTRVQIALFVEQDKTRLVPAGSLNYLKGMRLMTDASINQSLEGSNSAQSIFGSAIINNNYYGSSLPRRMPNDRPRREPDFVGRLTELKRILFDLQPGRVLTICGPGGIGKSALAAEAIYQLDAEGELVKRFPDGVFYHDFSVSSQADEAFESIAQAFDETLVQAIPMIAARRALSGRQALLILDGAEQAANLLAILKIQGRCGILVTSRRRQDAFDEWIDLPSLSDNDAITLLQSSAKFQIEDEVIMRRIVELVGGLPLAVRLIGRYLTVTEHVLVDYLNWLEKTPLAALDYKQCQLESIPLLMARSVAQLNKTTERTLAVIGLLALAPFEQKLVAFTLSISTNEVYRELGELVNYGLLRTRGTEEISHTTSRIEHLIDSPQKTERLHWFEVSHALIHIYAKERLSVPDDALKRLLAYYTYLAQSQVELGKIGYSRLNKEHSHLMRVLAQGRGQKMWREIRMLVVAIDDYLNAQGHWTERQQAIKYGLIASRRLGEQREEGIFLRLQGDVLLNMGLIETAVEN